MSLENLAKAFGSLSRLPDIVKNPSVEALGPIDFDQLEERDKPFFKKLLTLGQVDPDIIKRVLIMRTKLNNDIKLTNTEAEEMIGVLECKGFYLTDLDISGMKFGNFNLENAIIGGNFDSSNTTVRGDSCQVGMKVGGNSCQIGMKVGGNSDQSRMEIRGSNVQGLMKVGGNSLQTGMKVGDCNHQSRMEIGGSSIQVNMKVGGGNFQDGMKVVGCSVQNGMEVGGGKMGHLA